MRAIRPLAILAAALLLAATGASLSEAPAADAAFPGANGRIVYASAQNAVITTILPDGSSPMTLAQGNRPRWSADGQRIAFIRFVTQEIVELLVMNADGSDITPVGEYECGLVHICDPHLAWSPDGTRIALVPDRDVIRIIDVNSGDSTAIATSLPGQTVDVYPISWSPDGTKLLFSAFATNHAYHVWSINPDGTGLTNITGFDFDWAELSGDWSPDGTEIAYWGELPDTDNEGIWVAKADGSDRQYVIDGGWDPHWSPDGTKIVYYSALHDGIWTANKDGSNQTPLVDGDYPDWQPLPLTVAGVEFTQGIQELQTLGELQMSLTGGSSAASIGTQAFPGENGLIVFPSTLLQPSGIYAIPAEGGGPQFVTSGTAPAISGGGDEILFNGTGGVFRARLDGSHKQQVVADTPGLDQWSAPAWSPDDTQIAVLRRVSGGAFNVSELWIMDIDGSNRMEVLATTAQFDTLNSPRWSPDGKKILVGRGVQAANDNFLVTADVATFAETRVTPGDDAFSGDWSPDGSQIVYTTSVGEIYIANADGTGAQQVGAESGLFYPVWSPDGSRILVHVLGQSILKSMNLDGSDPVTVTDKSTGDEDWGPAGASVLALEFTQGIQELQTLGGLRSDIAADGQPPVPIVAGKPAAMRVYFAEVEENVDYMVEVSGEVNDTEVVTLTPGCTPTDRRRQSAGCSSVDFFFTPPQGDWSVHLTVKDISDVVVLDEEFELTSVEMPELDVEYLPICVRMTPGATPTCPTSFIESAGVGLTRTLYPAADGDLHYSRFPVPAITLDAPGVNFPDANAILASLRLRYELMALGSLAPDQLAGWLPQGGHAVYAGISDPVWYGSTGRVSWQTDTGAVPDSLNTEFTLAHEIAHNLGARHAARPDGCGAADPNTDWPYPDATIQEVGFNVAAGQAVPATTKDLMSYCTPPGTNIWISPHTYNKLVSSNFAPQAARANPAGTPNPYLVVQGTALADGSAATIESAYTISSSQPAAQPSPLGNYCLRTTGGAQLDYCFTLSFKEHQSGEPVDAESFAVRIPLPVGTTHVSLAKGFQELDGLDLSASAPSVDITEPGELNGEETIEWSGSDADGDPLKYAVMYSPDGGDTWYPIEVDTTDSEFTFDTSVLEGDEVLIRVLASDGLNTTSETTGPVTVIHGEERTWGDNNCSDEADPVDALLALRFDAGLSANTGVCPELGATISAGGVSRLWGDIDCSGDVGPVDGLKLLRFDSGLNVAQEPGCPPLGEPVNVSVAALPARAGRRSGA